MEQQKQLQIAIGVVTGVLILAIIGVYLIQSGQTPATDNSLKPEVTSLEENDPIFSTIDGTVVSIDGERLEIQSSMMDENGEKLSYQVVVEGKTVYVRRTMKTQSAIDAQRDEFGYFPQGFYLSDEVPASFEEVRVGEQIAATGIWDEQGVRVFIAHHMALEEGLSPASRYR